MVLVEMGFCPDLRKSISRRWKGDEASYVAKHMWISKTFGKAACCENKDCSYPKLVNAGRSLINAPKRFEWANISKKHKRDRSDYVQLCPSCHQKWDKGIIEVRL